MISCRVCTNFQHLATVLAASAVVLAQPMRGKAADGSSAVDRSDDLNRALASVRADEAYRADVFARAAEAVVCVFDDTRGGGGGSGVVIDPRGYGLTNFHVVQPFIETRRGYGGMADGRLYPLKVLGIDPGGDIAMFKLEGKERFDYAPLGDSEALLVGQWVAAMGNPFVLAEDYSPTITLGTISGLHRYQEGRGNLLEYADCIQVSTSINPGNSGGPLFDLDGRVIGINGRASFEERGRVNVGLGFAVSINQIKRFIPGLRAGRLLEHGTLGATVREAGGDLIVSTVQAFSAAEQSGVQLGDELIEVAGRRVRTANDYNNILATLPANWPMTLGLRRGDELVETTARLQRLPLGTPLLYLVDLEHNHAELAGVLDRHAEHSRMRVEEAFTRVVFEGRLHSVSDGESSEIALVVDSAEGSDFSANERVATTQAIEDDPIDQALCDEWQALARPLLARPLIDLHWELLAGDEVDGRIVNVIECRPDARRRLRWKFDWQTDALLQMTSGDQQQPEAVVWSPREPVTFGELHWPRVWTRRAQSGRQIVIEFDSISVESAERPNPPTEDTQEIRE
jgi:S1-C subfamily serine protease